MNRASNYLASIGRSGLILTSLFLAALFNGFHQGYRVENHFEPPNDHLNAHLGTPYLSLSSEFAFLLIIFVVVWLLARTLGTFRWSTLVQLLVSSVAIIPFTRIFRQMEFVPARTDPFSQLMNNSRILVIALAGFYLIFVLGCIGSLKWGDAKKHEPRQPDGKAPGPGEHQHL